jgi:hypothetical protein
MAAEFQKLTTAAEPPVEQIQPRSAAGGWRLPQALGSIAVGIAVGAAALTMNQRSTVPPAVESTESATAEAVATTGREALAGADIQLASEDVAEPAPQPVVDNTLRVTSSPSGARVTVNGIGWGSTPVTIRYLPPGTKVIRVTKDGFRGAETTVMLDGDAPASVRLTLDALGAQ